VGSGLCIEPTGLVGPEPSCCLGIGIPSDKVRLFFQWNSSVNVDSYQIKYFGASIEFKLLNVTSLVLDLIILV
jgi:hypothetical protein